MSREWDQESFRDFVRTWVSENYGGRKLFEAADALGIHQSILSPFLKNKSGLHFETAMKMLHRMGGDFSRALPTYNPTAALQEKNKTIRKDAYESGVAELAEAFTLHPPPLIGVVNSSSAYTIKWDKSATASLNSYKPSPLEGCFHSNPDYKRLTTGALRALAVSGHGNWQNLDNDTLLFIRQLKTQDSKFKIGFPPPTEFVIAELSTTDHRIAHVQSFLDSKNKPDFLLELAPEKPNTQPLILAPERARINYLILARLHLDL